MATNKLIASAAGMFLAAGAFGTTRPAHAADVLPRAIEWTLSPAEDRAPDEMVQLGVSYRTGKGGHSQMSRPVRLRELQGLTAAQLETTGGTPVRFRIVRDAGSLDCDGVVRRRRGTGECWFQGDARFAEALDRRGIGRPSPSQQLQLALHGAGLDVADELARQGYARPTISDLVQAGIFDVDVAYLRSIDASGYRAGTVDKLVKMRIHGVDPAYIKELAAIGPRYARLPIDQLVAFRIHGVKPALVRELAQLGYAVPADKIVAMSIHGVTPDFVRGMANAGYRRLTADQLIAMRIHGVSPDMARRANAALKTRN